MYSGVSDPRLWVLPAVIEEQARVRGDQTFVSIIEGESLTYRQLRDQAAQVAGMLAGLGARAGDRIAIMLPNGADIIRAWAGVGRLGAVSVMLNSDLSGTFLFHPLRDSQPKLLIIHDSYLERLLEFEGRLASFDKIVVVGSAPRSASSMHVSFEDWSESAPLDAPFPGPADLACLMYTSGTTGAPKGVLMPNAHCFLFGLGVVDNLGITADDNYYICLPLFHANALLMQLCGAMIAGGRAMVRVRFSASAWLSDVRTHDATVTHTLGAISAFILGQPPSPHDRAHRLRTIMCAPNVPEHERAWRDRFGIGEVVGAYGMTEVNIPLYGERSRSRPGSCGRAYDKYFEVEIRDPETDYPVPSGRVGEIMVRPRVANAFMAGYHNLPEKTVEAWRNFWFHTGDAGWMDPEGYVEFVDRMKDRIRRRGENISASDIEASFIDLPGVAEIAAFPVSSGIDGGEDEIMLAIVRRPGVRVTPDDVATHVRHKIPRFARPRYLEFRTSLPKTGTEKIRKGELRAVGITADTVDLEDLY